MKSNASSRRPAECPPSLGAQKAKPEIKLKCKHFPGECRLTTRNGGHIEESREGGGASAKIMGSGSGSCYAGWLLDSLETPRSSAKHCTEPSIQGKEAGIIYSLAPSHHGLKLLLSYCNPPALQCAHA